jgi:hypothetical protein
MIQESCAHPHFADRKFHLFELFDLNGSSQIAPVHRKKWNLHLSGQNSGEAGAGTLISQNANGVLGFVCGKKKRKSLNMVPVGVSQQQC